MKGRNKETRVEADSTGLSVREQACSPNTWEVEVGVSQVTG